MLQAATGVQNRLICGGTIGPKHTKLPPHRFGDILTRSESAIWADGQDRRGDFA